MNLQEKADIIIKRVADGQSMAVVAKDMGLRPGFVQEICKQSGVVSLGVRGKAGRHDKRCKVTSSGQVNVSGFGRGSYVDVKWNEDGSATLTPVVA